MLLVDMQIKFLVIMCWLSVGPYNDWVSLTEGLQDTVHDLYNV